MSRKTLPRVDGRRPLATVPEMAEHWQVPEKTVRDWHHRKVEFGPYMFRVGRYLRARWDDIDRYDAAKVGGAAA
ncbi:DNA-binding protein [Streptomyces boninensis]|uniref:DNA-binding protein n=1 Tax=Streptomyces boninensis TaxID=2039455 RepID=UPI003B211383